ncbi:hypothetical protein DRP77_00815 [Candidatus Poribacteria bacterium]|nr:MAG: hypothetical protein DRP77_00815 [Candidatus Poribacteria bacterium]
MRKTLALGALLLLFLAVLSAEAKTTTIGLFRFYVPLREEEISTFRMERLIVMTRGSYKDAADYTVAIYYHPWVPLISGNLYLESAYFVLKKLPGIGKLPCNGRIWVGRGRRINFGVTPTYSNRKTSEYGIVSDMFTHDRVQGIQLSFSRKPLFWGISVYNGYKLGVRRAGPVSFLADRGLDLLNWGNDIDKGKEICGKAGLRLNGKLEAGVSASFAKLFDDGRELTDPEKNDEVTLVMGLLGMREVNAETGEVEVSGELERDYKARLGLDATLTPEVKSDIAPSLLRCELYYGISGDLNHVGWQALMGIKVKPIRMDLYTRIGQILLDLEENRRNPANTMTWNLTQICVSSVFAIHKGLTLRVEFEKNLENPPEGAEEVDNDRLFFETLMAF